MKKEKRAIFLGDSITMGYGLKDHTRRYSTIFSKMNGFIEQNYGIQGTLIARAGISAMNNSAFIDRYQLLPEGDLIIVFGGTNDYWWSDTSVGDETTQNPAYFHYAMRRLCDGLRKKYSAVPIIFITPYQHYGFGNFRGGKDFMDAIPHSTREANFLGESLQTYCDLICEMCESYKIPVLDLSRCREVNIADDKNDRKRYTLDGCHPSFEGHYMLASKLSDFINRLGIVEE